MTTTVRSPPARPHIALHPSLHSLHLDSASTGEWGEDDAWDSGSDGEEPALMPVGWGSSNNATVNRKTSNGSFRLSSAPRPIARPKQNQSTSSLAFSYTHLSAPSASSYPPKGLEGPDAREEEGVSQSNGNANGWTIVSSEGDTADTSNDGMVVGEMDLPPSLKPPKADQGNIRPDVDDIVKDPLHSLRHRPPRSRNSSSTSSTKAHAKVQSREEHEISESLLRERSIRTNRRHKFVSCLGAGDVNIAQLRKLAWAGIPNDLRPVAWQLLLGYLPLHTASRIPALERKRAEYLSLVELAFAPPTPATATDLEPGSNPSPDVGATGESQKNRYY